MLMVPATRLPIEGLAHFDFVVYPVEESVTDKVCATMATYRSGRRSSRVRDLVDLAIYLTAEEMDGTYLERCLSRELRMGHMGKPRSFSVPESWKTSFAATYQRLARDSMLPTGLWEVERAEALVASCVDAALDGETLGKTWDPASCRWLVRGCHADRFEETGSAECGKGVM